VRYNSNFRLSQSVIIQNQPNVLEQNSSKLRGELKEISGDCSNTP